MDERTWVKKETFLNMAEEAGLKAESPHLEDVYVYARDVLPGLKVLDELDLEEVEPMAFPGVRPTVREDGR